MAGFLAVASAGLLFAGCASERRQRPKPIETREPYGFTITESERVSARLRGRFDEAREAIEAGEVERGVELLRSIEVEAPGLPAVHINLALAHERLEDLGEAEASLVRALEIYPRHAAARNELGRILRRRGRFDEAKEHYAQILALHPSFHLARKNLAILCDLYLEDLKCALEHYERYRAEVPDDEEVAIWIADLSQRVAAGGK